MDVRVQWLLSKGAIAAALYVAIIEQVDWLQYAVTAYIWWLLIPPLMAVLDGSTSRSIPAPEVPQPVALLFDLGVLASMFLAQWYWTAFAYSASRACIALLLSRTASKPR